ncbi:MAG: hypothetical protein LBF22_00440 [Deltaproteobacteria bacterium]|jgi:hypothetical protein|nr:hypothetical protein [Deltaproteobacteria bacterium]
MRVLILDELNSDEVSQCREYLKKFAIPGSLEDLYWYILPEKMLTPTQKELNENEGPYKICIEIGKDFIKFELLVRADMIHNKGAGSVDKKQMLHLYRLIDEMAKELKLVTCR